MNELVSIIKITSICNLACKYCYDHPRMCDSSSAIITDAVLERTIEQILSQSPSTARFIWHGGEPLAAGLDLFHKIITFQKKYKFEGQIIHNDIQTNGTLVNAEWVRFFKENEFNLGISIDGPQEFHDQYRVTHRGTGTWSSVMRAINLFNKNDIPFGVLTVVSKANIDYPDKLFEFFASAGLRHFDFLPHVTEPYELSVTPLEFSRFMKRIFDLWMQKDDPNINIRYLETALMGMLGADTFRGRMCSFAGTCADFVTINTNGDIGPCDNLYPLSPLRFGNILADDLGDLVVKAKRHDFACAVSSLPSDCLDCQYRSICNGGCTRNRYLRSPSLSEISILCDARKDLFQHMEARVKNLLACQ